MASESSCWPKPFYDSVLLQPDVCCPWVLMAKAKCLLKLGRTGKNPGVPGGMCSLTGAGAASLCWAIELCQEAGLCYLVQWAGIHIPSESCFKYIFWNKTCRDTIYQGFGSTVGLLSWSYLRTGSRPNLYVLSLVFVGIWLRMCMSLDSNLIRGCLSAVLQHCHRSLVQCSLMDKPHTLPQDMSVFQKYALVLFSVLIICH